MQVTQSFGNQTMHARHCSKNYLAAAFLVLIAAWVAAQQPKPSPSVTIHVATRLVQIDVIARDKNGASISDLKPSDITIYEDGRRQKIASFTFHEPSNTDAPVLPKGIYTNQVILSTNASTVIVLLDALNTQLLDQSYASAQMLQYLRTQSATSSRMAIFGLTNNLLLLQNFTDDPKTLRQAIVKESIHPSSLLRTPEDFQQLPTQGLTPASQELIRKFENDEINSQTDLRARITLAALSDIAKFVSGIPGRKTLIWVSGAFPLNRGTAESGVSFTASWYTREVEQTSTLLNDAQVSVYPVDARGLVGDLLANSSSNVGPLGPSGRSAARGSEVMNSLLAVESSQEAMREIADDTGGIAYLNRNDIGHAVELASQDGARYYSIAYYPTDKKWNGKFRKIELKSARHEVHLRYRRGYFASDPAETKPPDPKREAKEIDIALSDPLLSSQIRFLASAHPSAQNLATSITTHFRVDMNDVACQESSAGDQSCDLRLYVVAFSGNKAVAQTARDIKGDLKPADYAMLMKNGLDFDVPLNVPPGSYRLRLMVRDQRSGHTGTLDIPYATAVAQVSH